MLDLMLLHLRVEKLEKGVLCGVLLLFGFVLDVAELDAASSQVSNLCSAICLAV